MDKFANHLIAAFFSYHFSKIIDTQLIAKLKKIAKGYNLRTIYSSHFSLTVSLK